jgi:CRISPR system Cascade subunit CasC
MTKFLQLHLLTSYPPSNLNRDDSGRPKSAVFGGVERARISSQSLKRAWRTSDVFLSRLNEKVGKRTQRIGEIILEHLKKSGASEKVATDVAREIAAIFGKVKPEKDDNPTFTEQLVFVSPEEHARAISLAEKLAKKEIKQVKAEDILLQADTAVDIAMFGRMLADEPSFNREAAVQVAHAISTHRVTIEDDYYVAVDDLKRRDASEDSGTSFIGVQEFVSGVFYIYMCVDVALLKKNLIDGQKLIGPAVHALIESACKVGPTGKQASFASRARTLFLMAELGSDQPRSLAAAFLKAVGEREEGGDMAAASRKRLIAFRDKLIDGYGAGDLKAEMMDLTGEKAQGSLERVIEFVTKGAG